MTIGVPTMTRPRPTTSAVKITAVAETVSIVLPWLRNVVRESLPPRRKATIVRAADARKPHQLWNSHGSKSKPDGPTATPNTIIKVTCRLNEPASVLILKSVSF